ncbi:MAG: glycosyltransferase family 4 protein [Candidatus Schekmanbacteria bacterium]|nr:glycosyltransferase family 4 protein [Candidatus Schekmanbacteria bacterium]
MEQSIANSKIISAPHNILYLHEARVFGGGEKSLLNLIANLPRSRFNPLAACPFDGLFAERLRGLGVSVKPLVYPNLRDIAAVAVTVLKIRKIIRQEAIALVHANTPRVNIMAALAAKSCGIPVIWHARNLLSPNMIDLDRRFIFLTNKIICNSDAIRDRFADSPDFQRKTVTVLNGVNLKEFDPDIKPVNLHRELGIEPDIPLVGILSRLNPDKGHLYFIQAAVQLLKQGVKAHFVIVGEDKTPECTVYKAKLGQIINAGGATKNISFLGFRPDMPQVIAGLDIVVLASDAEACGRVLLETQAAGKPVIATNSGGTPELVENGETGILIPPIDAASLAQALHNLLIDKDLAAKMGQAGRMRIERLFSIERHVQKTAAIYQELLYHEHRH